MAFSEAQNAREDSFEFVPEHIYYQFEIDRSEGQPWPIVWAWRFKGLEESCCGPEDCDRPDHVYRFVKVAGPADEPGKWPVRQLTFGKKVDALRRLSSWNELLVRAACWTDNRQSTEQDMQYTRWPFFEDSVALARSASDDDLERLVKSTYGSTAHIHYRVTARTLELLGKMRGLRMLALTATDFDEALIADLSKLSRLEGLHLASGTLRASGVAMLDGLRRLKFLNLRRTRIDDESLRCLAGMPRLSWLDCGETPITGDGLRWLANPLKLQVLMLDQTFVDDRVCDHLRKARRLKMIGLYATRVSDAIASAFSRRSELEVLTLSETRVTDRTLDVLTKNCAHLRSLAMMGTSVTWSGILALRERNPKCVIYA